MEILSIPIAAGERKTIRMSGRYFEVMSAAAAFNVDFYDHAGGSPATARGMRPGVFIERPFLEFDLASSVAQTVEVIVSDFRAGVRAIESRALVDRPGTASFFCPVYADTGAGQAAVYAIECPAGRTMRLKFQSLFTGSGFVRFQRGTGRGTLFASGTRVAVHRVDSGTTLEEPYAQYASAANPALTVAEAPAQQFTAPVLFAQVADTIVRPAPEFVLRSLEVLYVGPYHVNQSLRGAMVAELA